jgi:hypothetical protein
MSVYYTPYVMSHRRTKFMAKMKMKVRVNQIDQH